MSDVVSDQPVCVDDFSREIRRGIPASNRVMAPVRWYGGKGRMARKIVPLLPAGRVYVEPYAGAASVFWHLDPPREVEVLNDLNGEIINLFRVLQDRDQFERLAHRLTWTPYSVDEFRRAGRCESHDPVDRAWSFFVRHGQGFSGKSDSDGNWGRVFGSSRGMAKTASNWRSRLSLLDHWHSRLTRVQLDNRDALDVIRYWDSPDTVFYLDPPYVHSTRAKASRNIYAHECDDSHHKQLISLLLGIGGRAVLSGYDSPLYRPLLDAGWSVHRWRVSCSAAGRVRGSRIRGEGAAKQCVPRTEVLWISPEVRK
jgi:DNA adenine methylase